MLLTCFHALTEIFNGVSDVTSFDSEGRTESVNWLMSPMVAVPALSRAVRSALVTCAQAISTLHEGQREGLCVGLALVEGEVYDGLRRGRVECLGRGVSSLPILEVNPHATTESPLTLPLVHTKYHLYNPCI
jgi:hypothetical protein